MKVTGYNKYTGDIVYEVEVADCRPEHNGFRPFD